MAIDIAIFSHCPIGDDVMLEWERLRTEVSSCVKCSLKQMSRNAVFGEGRENSILMVVGEAPGHDEDVQGRPFVGRSGKLLDVSLAETGFSRQTNTFIANIVKCRPPGNRAPTTKEMDACLPYLQKQIEMIRPKVLILLGNTALRALLDNKGKIGEYRGCWHKCQGVWTMPTYHPAAILRNPSLINKFHEDILEVAQKINS